MTNGKFGNSEVAEGVFIWLLSLAIKRIFIWLVFFQWISNLSDDMPLHGFLMCGQFCLFHKLKIKNNFIKQI